MLMIFGLLCVAMLGAVLLPSDEAIHLDEDDSVLDHDLHEDDEANATGLGLLLDGQEGTSGNEQDTLVGGVGDDYLVAGKEDILFGGDGADSFEVPKVGPAYIQDFEGEDTIIIPYSGSEPVIEFAAMDHGTMIFADGVAVAEVKGVYDFEDAIKMIAINHIDPSNAS